MVRRLVLAVLLLGAAPSTAHATSGMLVSTECFATDYCDHTLPGDATTAEQVPGTHEVYIDSGKGDVLFLVAAHLDAGGRLERDSCLSSAPYSGCATVADSATWGGRTWAPDGRTAYALSHSQPSDGQLPDHYWITVLSRDPVTQVVSEKGCYGTVPGCVPLPFADQHILQTAMSPDGRQLYALSAATIVVYARNPGTGSLSAVQCVKRLAPAGDPCASFRGGGGGGDFHALALTPDGKQLVYSYAGFAALNRDPATGLLTQPATGANVCETRGGADGCLKVGKDERLGGGGTPVFTADGTRMFQPNPYKDGIDTFRRDPATGAFTQSGEVSGPTASPTKAVVLSPDEKNVYGLFDDSGNKHYGAVIDFYGLRAGILKALPAPFACQGAYQRLECGGQASIGGDVRGLLFGDDAHAIVTGAQLSVMRRATLPAPTFTFGGLPTTCHGDFTLRMTVKGSRAFTTTLTADDKPVVTSRRTRFRARVRARRLQHDRDYYQVGRHLIEATAVDGRGNRYAVLKFVRFGRRGC